MRERKIITRYGNSLVSLSPKQRVPVAPQNGDIVTTIFNSLVSSFIMSVMDPSMEK